MEASSTMNIEEKVWLLVKKYWLPKTDIATKTLPFAGIWWFHWTQGENVAHFSWFGKPWYKHVSISGSRFLGA